MASKVQGLQQRIQAGIEARGVTGWEQNDASELQHAVAARDVGLLRAFANVVEDAGLPLYSVRRTYHLLVDHGIVNGGEIITAESFRGYLKLRQTITEVISEQVYNPEQADHSDLLCYFMASPKEEQRKIIFIVENHRVTDCTAVKELLTSMTGVLVLDEGTL